MRSTSVHWLSADNEQSRARLRLWTLLNRINNNTVPNFHGQHLKIRPFRADASGELWARTSPQSSPVEKLCDLFWMQLPWERILAELGALHIFDTGCGPGNLLARLQQNSAGYVAGYTGYDIRSYRAWNSLVEQHPNVRFVHGSGADTISCVPESVNFFVSQSAIQRMRADLDYFRAVRDFLRRTKNEAVQIHLFPSRIGLDIYERSGVRQYSPRTVSYIAGLFKGFSYSMLYKLGGRACNAIHWRSFTRPAIRDARRNQRDTHPQEYDRVLRQAVLRDNRQPNGEPSYYALVIHSNFQSRIFD